VCLCLSAWPCLSQKLEKRDVIKKEQKEKIISLYLLCVFCLSRLCLSVRHRSWGKKKRDGEKEQKKDLFLFERSSTKLQEPPFLTYLLTANQNHTTNKTKQHEHSLLLTSKHRENTQERKQNKTGTWQKKDIIYICIRKIAVDPNSPHRKYPLQLSPANVSLFLAPSSLVCLLRSSLPPPQFCFSLSLSLALPLLLLQFPIPFFL
jgi:hypothetical protein